MRVAVFENIVRSVEGALNWANLKFYNNQLEFDYYPKFQDKPEDKKWKDYEVIIVDLDLAKGSDLDGFGVIDTINKEVPEMINKTIILTGHERNVPEILESKNLPSSIQIIYKPANYLEVKDAFKRVGLSSTAGQVT